jgi:hypothetical protein
VTVAVTPAPLDPASLRAALRDRYAAVRAHDYAAAAQRHRATVMVSAVPAGPAAAADAAVLTGIVACHAVLCAVAGLARPEAMLWRPTDTLFVPEEIPPAGGIGFPVSLVTRPAFRAAPPDARGRRRTSFVSAGAEAWFGRPVVVEPTALDLPEALAVVDFCIMRRLAGDDLLARPGRHALPEGIEATVRHHGPSREFPQGSIGIALRQRKGAGEEPKRAERPAPAPRAAPAPPVAARRARGAAR